jgi:glucose dehydrogenase
MTMTTRPGGEYRPGASFQGGNASFGGLDGIEKWGILNAIHPATGKVAWEVRTNEPLFGGVIATAGGLVFAGQSTNSFDAWDADTGEHLWAWETDAGCNAAPITYALDGKQYVVVACGGSRYLRRDRDNPAEADAIIAFALP